MLRRYALGFSNVGRQFSTMGSNTPLEDVIRAKVRRHLSQCPSSIDPHRPDHRGAEPADAGNLQ